MPSPRRLIAAKDWSGALAELRAQPQAASADWNNLMGYTLRKQATPDLARAETYYLEALRLNPGHRGANEYLGELYLMKGDVASAEQRLAVLAQLCPGGCEEREDLARSVAAFKARKP
jgi:Flp pilus assembly protein TadD